MTPVEYQPYDFAAAGSVPRPLSRSYQPWLKKFAELFVDRWKDFSAGAITVQALPVTARNFVDEQNRWSDLCLGMPIRIVANSMSGLLISKRQDMLRLLLQVLGGDDAEQVVDRQLTTVELSLVQLIFEQVAATLAEAWPRKEVLSIATESVDSNPHRSRMFEPEQPVIMSGFVIACSAGKTAIEWLLPKQALAKLLNAEAETAPPTNGLQKIPVANIAGLGVTISASLGTAMLNMSQLMSMSAGDIVALDQEVTSPIVLSVNDKPLFEAWPGRIGNKQCLRVESINP